MSSISGIVHIQTKANDAKISLKEKKRLTISPAFSLFRATSIVIKASNPKSEIKTNIVENTNAVEKLPNMSGP